MCLGGCHKFCLCSRAESVMWLYRYVLCDSYYDKSSYNSILYIEWRRSRHMWDICILKGHPMAILKKISTIYQKACPLLDNTGVDNFSTPYKMCNPFCCAVLCPVPVDNITQQRISQWRDFPWSFKASITRMLFQQVVQVTLPSQKKHQRSVSMPLWEENAAMPGSLHSLMVTAAVNQ